MNVSQVLCAAGPVDAVTNQALQYRALFKSWGWEGSDYAAVRAPGLARRVIRALGDLQPGSEDVLVLHYSGYVNGLERMLEGAKRSVLVSHNVTPSRYFWAHEPVEAVRCELARGQLGELVQLADVLAGVSHYNLGDLRALSGRDGEVIPVLFDRAKLPPAEPRRRHSDAPTVLFVGRLVPHKRQDLVIRAFGEYRRQVPGARLLLVGVSLSPAFESHLRELAAAHAPGAVSFESGISLERLVEHYRSADAFLCLSEHEGFCIPLLEAFHFGVPVIARDAGAIAEVAGDAAILLGEGDDVLTAAELLEIVVGDDELRGELRERAGRRLEVYDYRRSAQRIRSALTTAVHA